MGGCYNLQEVFSQTQSTSRPSTCSLPKGSATGKYGTGKYGTSEIQNAQHVCSLMLQ